MSKKISIEVIDTTEGHYKIIRQYWNGFALRAYEGYVGEGRGTVTFDLNGITEMEINADSLYPLMDYAVFDGDVIESMEEDNLKEKFRKIKEVIDTYNPNKEIIVLVYGRNYKEDAKFQVHKMPHESRATPVEIYQKEHPVN